MQFYVIPTIFDVMQIKLKLEARSLKVGALDISFTSILYSHIKSIFAIHGVRKEGEMLNEARFEGARSV